MADATHSQSSSPFFNLPPELRRRIYAELCDGGIHIFRHQGRVTHAPCLWSRSDFVADGADEVTDARQPAFAEFAAQTRYFDAEGTPSGRPGGSWARKLDSRWARHWECEEGVLGRLAAAAADGNGAGLGSPLMAMMLVCRKMYWESMNTIMESVPLIFMDYSTASELLTGTNGTTPTTFTPHPWLRFVRTVHFVFQMDLGTFNSITRSMMTSQDVPALPLVAGSEPGALIRSSAPWSRVQNAILGLRHLRSATFWLDMSNMKPWTTAVKERVIFGPLLRHGTQLAERQVRVSLNLPHLVERGIRQECHLVGELPRHIVLRRHSRPRFWVQEDQTVREWNDELGVGPYGYERDPPWLEDEEDGGCYAGLFD